MATAMNAAAATASFGMRPGAADKVIHILLQAAVRGQQNQNSRGLWDASELATWLLLLFYSSVLGLLVLSVVCAVRGVIIFGLWMAQQTPGNKDEESVGSKDMLCEVCEFTGVSTGMIPRCATLGSAFAEAFNIQAALHDCSNCTPYDVGVVKAAAATAAAAYCMPRAEPADSIFFLLVSLIAYLLVFVVDRLNPRVEFWMWAAVLYSGRVDISLAIFVGGMLNRIVIKRHSCTRLHASYIDDDVDIVVDGGHTDYLWSAGGWYMCSHLTALSNVVTGAFAVPLFMAVAASATGYPPTRDCWLAVTAVIGASSTLMNLGQAMLTTATFLLWECAVVVVAFVCNLPLLLDAIVWVFKLVPLAMWAATTSIQLAWSSLTKSCQFVQHALLWVGAAEASLLEYYKTKQMLWRYQQQLQRSSQKRTTRGWLQHLLLHSTCSSSGSNVGSNGSSKRSQQGKQQKPPGRKAGKPQAVASSRGSNSDATLPEQHNQTGAAPGPVAGTAADLVPAQQLQLHTPSPGKGQSGWAMFSWYRSCQGQRPLPSAQQPAEQPAEQPPQADSTSNQGSTGSSSSSNTQASKPAFAASHSQHHAAAVSPPSPAGTQSTSAAPDAVAESTAPAAAVARKPRAHALASAKAGSLKRKDPTQVASGGPAAGQRCMVSAAGPEAKRAGRQVAAPAATGAPAQQVSQGSSRQVKTTLTAAPPQQKCTTQSSGAVTPAKPVASSRAPAPEQQQEPCPWSPALQVGDSSSSSSGVSSGSSGSSGSRAWMAMPAAAAASSDDDPWSVSAPLAAAAAVPSSGTVASLARGQKPQHQQHQQHQQQQEHQFTLNKQQPLPSATAQDDLFVRCQQQQQLGAAMFLDHLAPCMQLGPPVPGQAASATGSAAVPSAGNHPAAAGAAQDSSLPGGGSSSSSSRRMCVLCWTAAATHLLAHNKKGHMCLCGGCCAEYDYKRLGCPICQEQVQHVVQVFST